MWRKGLRKFLLGPAYFRGCIGVRFPALIALDQELVIESRERSKTIGRGEGDSVTGVRMPEVKILSLPMKHLVLARNDPTIIATFRHPHLDRPFEQKSRKRSRRKERDVAQAQVWQRGGGGVSLAAVSFTKYLRGLPVLF
jgi:hypothetical protein